MLDLQSLYIRGFLEHLRLRVATTAETLSWVEGEPELIAEELVPPFTKRSEAAEAFARYSKQVQSLGPRALRVRRQGAVATVSWSKVPKATNDRLDELPLLRIGREIYKDLFVSGIAAVWPLNRRSAVEGRPTPRLQRLGGHLELLWNDDDVGGEPAGLLQVTGSANTYEGSGIRYDVRIYDFEERTLRVWLNRLHPGYVGDEPDEIYPKPGTSETLELPIVVYSELNQDGYPIGEAKVALPLLKAEVSQALRLLRTSDAHSYPIWNLAGPYEEPKRLGTNVVFRSKDPSSRAERVQPADLSTLFEEADRAADRIRTDLLMPITGAGQIPSGEALIQANAGYNNASDDGARLVSDALSRAVRGLALLLGIELDPAFRVIVKPDRELKRTSIATMVREDYEKGLVSLEIALAELEQFYPGMTTDMLEDWLEENREPDPEPVVDRPAGAFADDATFDDPNVDRPIDDEREDRATP